MATVHYSASLTLPDGREASAEEIHAALLAAFPGAEARVRQGPPRILVFVPEDPEDGVTFSVDGRVSTLLVDPRGQDAETLEMMRERVSRDEPVEIADRRENFGETRNRVVKKLDDLIHDARLEANAYR